MGLDRSRFNVFYTSNLRQIDNGAHGTVYEHFLRKERKMFWEIMELTPKCKGWMEDKC